MTTNTAPDEGVTAVAEATKAALERVQRDTLARARRRMQLALTMYDNDEPNDPGQPLVDLVTDVLHECEARGVDVDDIVRRATRMHTEEKKDWGLMS